MHLFDLSCMQVEMTADCCIVWFDSVVVLNRDLGRVVVSRVHLGGDSGAGLIGRTEDH